jgi:hypothetical protein
LFFEILTIPVALTESPFARGVVAPDPDRVLIVFPETVMVVVVEALVTANPVTVDAVPVDDNVLIVFPLIVIVVGEIFPQVRPVTFPPVPVDDKALMVLLVILKVVAVLTVDPMVTPVIVLWPVMPVMMLLEKFEAKFQEL